MGRIRLGFPRALGRAHRLRKAANDFGQRFIKGISEANTLFPAGAG